MGMAGASTWTSSSSARLALAISTARLYAADDALEKSVGCRMRRIRLIGGPPFCGLGPRFALTGGGLHGRARGPDQEDRHAGAAQDRFRDAPEDDPPEPAAAMGAHHDQIDFLDLGGLDDGGGRRPVPDMRLDPVAPVFSSFAFTAAR